MRYLMIVLILSLLITSCNKGSNYRYNTSRSALIGNYHYKNFQGLTPATENYDMSVTIPSNDDGNSINIPYINSSFGAIFGTTDSSFAVDMGGARAPGPNGHYAHDSIVIYTGQVLYPSQGNGPPVYVIAGIGIKY